MKVEYVKNHKLAVNIQEVEDSWGNISYSINTGFYKTLQEAKLAARDLVENEFRSRFVNLGPKVKHPKEELL